MFCYATAHNQAGQSTLTEDGASSRDSTHLSIFMQMAGSYILQHLHARVHKACTAAAPRLGGSGTPRSVSKDLSEIAQSLQTRQKEQGSRERVQTFRSTDQCLQNHSAPKLSARWALKPPQAKRDIIWQGNTRGRHSDVHRLLAVVQHFPGEAVHKPQVLTLTPAPIPSLQHCL